MFGFKMQWPFKRESAEHDTKSVLGQNDVLTNFLLYGTSGGSTPTSAINLYNQSSAVSVPINKIAEAFATIEPVIQDGDKILTSHPVLDLLNNPSPFYDGTLFMETLAKDYLITNETFMVGIGGLRRPPLELQPISPKYVSHNEGENGLVHNFIISGNTMAGNYMMKYGKGKVNYYNGNLKELKQIRGYSTHSNSLLRGQSPLVSAAAEARQHILGNTHNKSMLERGGNVSSVFHFEEDLSPDDFNELKQRVRSEYGGASNAGKIGVTAGPAMKILQLGINNKDMDFATLQKLARDSVALVYKVPLALVSNDAAKFDNYANSLLALYDDAVLPLTDRLFTGLTYFLMPRFGLDPNKVKISYDILSIPALRERVLKELETRKNINIESDNELRPLLAREPYQGGDSILKPSNMIPAGTDLFTDDNVPKLLNNRNDDE